MKNLVPVLCLLFGACAHAQQPFPGINITPNPAGTAGKINLRDSTNTNPSVMQWNTWTGATATDGRIILTPGNVASAASVVIPAVRANEPSLIIKDSTTGGTFQGISFQTSAGTEYLRLTSNGGSGAAQLQSVNGPMQFTGANVTGEAFQITNITGSLAFKSKDIQPLSPSTFDFGASSNRWATIYGITTNTTNLLIGSLASATLKVDGSGNVGIVSGSGTNCVLVNGTSTACSSSFTNPMTTTGDMIYSSSGSTPARLGIGSSGQCLTVSGGLPAWASCGSGANTTLSNLTSPTAINQDLLPSGTRALGSTSSVWNASYTTSPYGVNQRVCQSGFSTCFLTQMSAIANILNILDPSSNTVLALDSSSSPGSAKFRGHILPITRNTTDVGQAFPNEFRNAYFAGTVNGDGGFKISGSTVIDNSLDATLRNVTAAQFVFTTSGYSAVTGNDTNFYTALGTLRWSIIRTTGNLVPASTYDIGTSGARIGSLYAGSVDSSGNIVVGSGATYAVSGGFFGQDYTGGINVGTSTLFFKRGILYACTGTC